MSLLGIGTPVVIREIRSGENRRFAAIVTGADPGSPRHYVTKFNANGANRAGPATEVIAKALRFDDGAAPQDGEDYVIENVTGVSAEIGKSLAQICTSIEDIKTQLAAVRDESRKAIAAAEFRLKAVALTIAQFGDSTLRDAVTKALEMGVLVKLPEPEEPARAPAPAQSREAYDEDGFATNSAAVNASIAAANETPARKRK